MLVLHANWSRGKLCLWAESAWLWAAAKPGPTAQTPHTPHPATGPATADPSSLASRPGRDLAQALGDQRPELDPADLALALALADAGAGDGGGDADLDPDFAEPSPGTDRPGDADLLGDAGQTLISTPTPSPASAAPPRPHGFAISPADLRSHLARLLGPDLAPHLGLDLAPDLAPDLVPPLVLKLPSLPGVPIPSPRLAHAVGFVPAVGQRPELARWIVPTLMFDPGAAAELLSRLDESQAAAAPDAIDQLHGLATPATQPRSTTPQPLTSGPARPPAAGATSSSMSASSISASSWASAAAPDVLVWGSTVRYWAAALRFVRHMLAQQRFVPGLVQDLSGELRGLWQPWMSDERTAERASRLLAAMPPAARACDDEFASQPWMVFESFLTAMTDALCRRTLRRENMAEAIESRDPAADAQVAWLRGLLGQAPDVPLKPSARPEMVRIVRRWLSGLEERGRSSAWRLSLHLREPEGSDQLPDLAEPGDMVSWPLSFHLQSIENPRLFVDAADIWLLASETITLEGRRLEQPRELLLAELARACRVYPALERILESDEPALLPLSTRQAYQFLREYRGILQEQGFGVETPEWWDWPTARLGARLRIDSDPADPMGGGMGGMGGMAAGPTPVSRPGPGLGLAANVEYSWEISIAGTTLSLQEFEQLAGRRIPLVRINGRWVEIRPEDVQAAMKFIQENPGGSMTVAEAIRMAYASDARQTGIPVTGLVARGWLSAFFGEHGPSSETVAVPEITPPPTFHGILRPYQVRGVSWMTFMERFGFGPCLADDMGLGKTIQMLALLAYERHLARQALANTPAAGTPAANLASAGLPAPPAPAANLISAAPAPAPGSADQPPAQPPPADQPPLPPHGVPPTLLIVPMSVLGNWVHEARRFCPELRMLLHHGVDRRAGDAFVHDARNADAIITTYALAHRDRETLGRVHWQRIVLDEAQYIKNPTTKQALAVRALISGGRVALTGTPVENRLSELWSIMDFLNPGFLGSAANFRQRFALPIERYRDAHRGRQLRELVRPMILRRLKSDPSVAADLPDKLETREYSHLTPEQAQLYEALVQRMLSEVDRAQGMQRRGLVLATLIKLKQVCNHPALLLKDHNFAAGVPPAAARSGKCLRLIEMLDEILAGGQQALIFTQFRQMAELLATMLRHDLDRDILLYHGGTPQAQRDAVVAAFQRADGTTPILIVSLRAGGVGLNLTAATHVFHFDRWWNPAVENQATDRAYRIGQDRAVHVHKFVVRGTLEERIDEMIEQKTDLAQAIIGSGERHLTELSTDQLRDLLTLRKDAVGEDP